MGTQKLRPIPKPWGPLGGLIIIGFLIIKSDLNQQSRVTTPTSIVLTKNYNTAEAQALWQWEVVEDDSDASAFAKIATKEMKRGEFGVALKSFEKSLEIDSTNALNWNNYGICLVRSSHDVSALDAFSTARNLDSTLTRAWLNEGIVLCRNKAWTDATFALEEATKRGTGKVAAKAHAYLGQAYRGLNQSDLAKWHYNTSIELYPQSKLARLGMCELEKDPTIRVKLLKQLIALNPNEAVYYFVLGKTYEELGELDLAERALTNTLDLNPQDNELVRALTQYYLDNEQVDKALLFINDAVISDSLKAENQFLLAKVASKKGDYSAALEHYNNALKDADGEMVDALLNRGVILKKLGQLEEAEASYLKAIDLRPKYIGAWYNLGLVRTQMNDINGAIEAYNSCLKHDPYHYKAKYNLGVLYRDTDQTNKAITAWEQAISIDANQWKAWLNLAQNLEKLDKDIKAGAMYDSLVNRFPGDPKNWYHRSQFYASIDNYESAEISLLEAIKLDPTYFKAWMALGRVHVSMKKYEDARNEYKEAVDLDPQNKNARYNLAIQHNRLGEFSESAKQLERCLALDKNYDKALNKLVSVYEDLGDKKSLIRVKDLNLKNDDWLALDVDSMYSFARELHKNGWQEQAIKRYESAIKEGAEGVWPIYWLGKAYEQQGDINSARMQYLEALQINPKHKFSIYRSSLVAETEEKSNMYWNQLETLYPDFAKEKSQIKK